MTRRPRPKRAQAPRYLVPLLLLPTVAIFGLFVMAPVVQAARYSLFQWNGLEPLTHFVGLDNYTRLLGDPAFRRALLNNLAVIVVAVGVQLPIALMIATLLTGRVRGRALFRLAFFVPYVISEVVAAVLWKLILAPEGLLDASLKDVGLGRTTQLWLADPHVVMMSILFVLTWKYFGFYTLLFLAALQAVPTERVEAAVLDGANSWQIFRYITLPAIAPTVRIATFLAMIGAIQLFDLVWVMTKGGPVGASTTMVSYMVGSGLQNYEYGYASAVAVTISLLAFTMSLAYQRFVLSRDHESNQGVGAR